MKIKNGILNSKKKEISNNAFLYNEKIKTLILSKRTKVIHKTAFNGCRNLQKIAFSENLTEIHYGAFLNCSSLKEVYLPPKLKVLGECAFKDNINLEKIILPELKILPKNLLRNCFNLKEVVIPDSVEVIEEGCFHSCTALEKIVLGNNVKEIGDFAFKRCLNLENIVFPESLKKIGNRAFEGCKKLKFVTFNSELSYIGKAAFHNKVFEDLSINGTAFCSSFIPREQIENCITISIPAGVKNLLLGFDGILPVAFRDTNKTCTNHILSLEKERLKIFIPDTYYSYDDLNDFIIINGDFDFSKYDNQLNKAETETKPFVAVFRLAYPQNLSEYHEKIYFDIIKVNKKDLAFFSVEINDEKVLTYLFENFSFDTEFTSSLFSFAAKKGFMNLQTIISSKKQNTAIFETEELLNELLV